MRTYFVLAALTACLGCALWPGVAGGATNLCAAADALLAERHLDEAEDAYRGLVRNHPATATCAAEGLSRVEALRKERASKPTPFEQAWLAERWHDVTPWLPVAAILLGLLWLLSAALFRQPTVRLAEVAGSPKDRETLGAELVASVRGSLEQFATSAGDLGIVGQWGDAVEIPGEIATVVPQGMLAAAIVQLLQRLPFVRRIARQFELAGQLYTADGEPGSTLALTSRTGRQSSAVTLQASTYDPPRAGTDGKPDALVMGPAAAAWLIYELYGRRPRGRRALAGLRRRLGGAGLSAYSMAGAPRGRRRVVRVLLNASLQGAPPLGGATWEGFAVFSAATRLDQAGRSAEARRLYLNALDRDPASGVAAFNLARLEVLTALAQKGDDTDETRERERMVAAALEQLDGVRKEIEAQHPVRRLSVQLDPLWYRATYASAAIPLRLRRELRRSCLIARELVRVLEGTLLVTRPRRDGELRHFLLDVEPAVLALYAAALVLDQGPTPAPGFQRLPTRRDLADRLHELDHRAIARFIDTCSVVASSSANNLASYYSLAGGAEPGGWRRSRYLRRSLVELRATFDRRGRDAVAAARTDYMLEAVREDDETAAGFERLCRFAENPLF